MFANFSHNIDVLERLKSWEKITEKLNRFEQILKEIDIKGLENKIDDIEWRIDDLESK